MDTTFRPRAATARGSSSAARVPRIVTWMYTEAVYGLIAALNAVLKDGV